MIKLQYLNGTEWQTVSSWATESIAWISLGPDTRNYRTVDENGSVLTDKSKREYNMELLISDDDMVVTVDEWVNNLKNNGYSECDGDGYWVKDGYVCREDEVFSSEPEDATHVIWYNK